MLVAMPVGRSSLMLALLVLVAWVCACAQSAPPPPAATTGAVPLTSSVGQPQPWQPVNKVREVNVFNLLDQHTLFGLALRAACTGPLQEALFAPYGCPNLGVIEMDSIDIGDESQVRHHALATRAFAPLSGWSLLPTLLCNTASRFVVLTGLDEPCGGAVAHAVRGLCSCLTQEANLVATVVATTGLPAAVMAYFEVASNFNLTCVPCVLGFHPSSYGPPRLCCRVLGAHPAAGAPQVHVLCR